jgi:capsular exopolysaccharide synthesis family protein
LEPLETAGPAQETRGVSEYLQLLRGRKLVIALFALLAGAVGYFGSYLVTPIYRARTVLEIDFSRPSDLIGSGGPGELNPESSLQTQLKILQSRTLTTRVREKLMTPDTMQRYSYVDHLAPLLKTLHLEGNSPAGPPPITIQARLPDTSRIIEMTCDSPSAAYASDFANLLANEYIDSNLEEAWKSAQRTTDWLSRQLEEVRKKLQASEDSLQQYGRNSGLTYTGESQSIEDDKLKQVQEELNRAVADRVTKQSSFEIATKGSIEAVPQVADSGRLKEYQSKLAELSWTMAELRSIYTPEHYRVTRVQAQINEVEAILKQERAHILERIQNDYLAAARREQLLSANYASQLQLVADKGKKAVYYGILKREVETNRQLYDQLSQRVKQVGINSTLKANDVRIMDAAEVPIHPIRPDFWRNAAEGAVAGAFLAIMLILGREFVNRSLRAPGETAFHLGIPELGVIPAQASVQPRIVPPAQRMLLLGVGDGEGTPGKSCSVELVTWRDRPSLMAESFRSVMASVLVGRNGERPGVIVVTSAARGEGKTTVVSNLGIAIAEIKSSVLLIDADLRKPSLHDIFGLPNTWGLSDLLRERTSLKDAPREAISRSCEIEGLYILPAGPGTASIATLLYSSRMGELIERLRREFTIVLIDTPPMSYLFDARALGQHTDGAILVIQAAHTTRDAAIAARRRLADDGIPVLGTILNGWDLKSKTRYGYYPDGNYYSPRV